MYSAALAFSLFCFCVVALAFWRSGAVSVFHPLTFYLAFHGLLYVFRPMLAQYFHYRVIYDAFGFTPSAEDKLNVILASNLGFLAFSIACLWKGNVPMQFKLDSFASAERRRLGAIFPWVLVICLPIGGYSMLHFWSSVGTGTAYEGLLLDTDTGIVINTRGNGYLLEAQTMLGPIAALLAWIYRFRLVTILPIIAFVVLRAGTGGRGPFIVALAMLSLMYLYERREKFPNAKVMMITAAAVVAFVGVGSDRGYSIRRALGMENAEYSQSTGAHERFLEGMDFGNLEFFEYIVFVVPKRSGTYDYFLDNLQLFTEPIPRTLWADKPIGPPIQRLNLMRYAKPFGMTRSLPGEGWYAWGWYGVVIWCGLWGLVLGWIYRSFVKGPQNALHTATYMVFLPILIIAYRDGSLVTIFRQGVFYFLPLLIWFGVARYKELPTARSMRLAARRKLSMLKMESVRQPVSRSAPGLSRRSTAPGIPAQH